jgi:hypothetical protein
MKACVRPKTGNRFLDSGFRGAGGLAAALPQLVWISWEAGGAGGAAARRRDGDKIKHFGAA